MTGYQFRDYAAVRAFLQSHAELLPVLREARRRIKGIFGLDTEITLEVCTDPESDDGQKLGALIFTALPVDEALARLDKFDQEWWLDTAARGADGLLQFDAGYKCAA